MKKKKITTITCLLLLLFTFYSTRNIHLPAKTFAFFEEVTLN